MISIQGLTPSFGQEFLIHNYDDNNLPSLSVTGVCQDSTGVMWFSTWAGLVRYDGSTWEIVDLSNKTATKSYRHILYDNQERVWAIGLGSPFRLLVLDGQQWTEHSIPPPLEWGWDILGFGISEQPDGSVFLAVTSNQNFFFWDGKSWHHYGISENLGEIRSMSFAQDKLYLASNRGLFEFDPTDKSLGLISLNGLAPEPIQALIAMDDCKQGLWLVGSDWIGQLQGDQFRRLGSGLSLDFSKLETGTVALPGPSGGVFFGGTEEFYHFHPQCVH